MKVKTSELSGVALDWAVFTALDGAIAGGWYVKDGCFMAEEGEVSWKYQPSTDWRKGGAIIERERIDVMSSEDGWVTFIGNEVTNEIDPVVDAGYGETPLIAAMRCYVASKLGDEVEVPDEVA